MSSTKLGPARIRAARDIPELALPLGASLNRQNAAHRRVIQCHPGAAARRARARRAETAEADEKWWSNAIFSKRLDRHRSHRCRTTYSKTTEVGLAFSSCFAS